MEEGINEQNEILHHGTTLFKKLLWDVPSFSLKAFHILKKTAYGTMTPSKAWSRPSPFEQQTNYLLCEPCLHAGSL